MEKPVVFIASPYTKGDAAVNTHFQCKIFDQLLTEDRVIPIVPLWTHFQHLLFPRPYEDWLKYDQALLRLYDCCLRLPATHEPMDYRQSESSGADAEVATFQRQGKPVFFSIEEMYAWLDAKANALSQETQDAK
jgi:hypothetical protein